jgi:hypothetical protein
MKYTISLMLLCTALTPALLAQNNHDNDLSADIPALSPRDYALLSKEDIDYVYVPAEVKRVLKHLMPEMVREEMLLSDEMHIAPESMMHGLLNALLDDLEIARAHEESIAVLRAYHQDIKAGHAFIFIEEDEGDDTLSDHEDAVHRKKKCKIYCTLLVRNGLRAGTMVVAGNAVIDGSITVDGSITASGSVNPLTGGTNGQLFIGRTGGPAQFNTVTSSNGSVSFTPGPGTLGLKATPVFGNVARVDQIYGNDSTGAVGGAPFATITAALAAAGAYAGGTNPVVVWVFPGVYSDTATNPETFPLTIPNNVNLVGISRGGTAGQGGVTIQKLNANAALTLINMQANTMLENVTLNLTGNTSGNLFGVNIVTGPSTIDRVNITVTNPTGEAFGIEIASNNNVTIDTATINASSLGIDMEGGGSLITSKCNIAANGSTGEAIFFNVGNTALYQDVASTLQGYLAYAGVISANQSFLLGTNLISKIPLFATGSTYVGTGAFTPGCSPTILVWNVYADVAIIAPGSAGMLSGSFNSAPSSDPRVGYLLPEIGVITNLYAAVISPSSAQISFGISKASSGGTFSSVSPAIIPALATSGAQITTGQLFAANAMVQILIGVSANTTVHYPMASAVLY